MASGPVELVRPCTWDDLVSNTDIQNEINTSILEGGGGGDTYKVKVNGADASPDYLHAKLYYVTADDFDAATDVPVYSYTDSNSTEKLMWRADDIGGYDPGATMMLTINEGTIGWAEFNESIDSFTVKCTNADTTPSYLHNAFSNPVTAGGYVSDADLIIGNETQDVAADENELLFVDVSAIPGHSVTDLKILGIDGNVTQFFEPDFFSTVDLAEGLAIDITEAAGTFTISVDLTEISGYDATKNQLIWNNLGGIGWTQANLLTVKIPTTIEVSVVGSGPYSLRVKLNYQNYQFFGKTDGSTGSIIGDLTLTDVTVNSPTAIELNDLTTSLQSKLVYTPKTLHLLNAAADGGSTNFNDSVPIDDCA